MADDSNAIVCLIDQWLAECSKGKTPSRNTVAAGIVALDHLVGRCPVEPSDVFSTGGELAGARNSLGSTLEKYGVPSTYLKEVTTRQAGNFARRLFELLEWGKKFEKLPDDARAKQLLAGMDRLTALARDWLARKNLRINCDLQFTPAAWIGAILEEARARSGGKVEQHLVGAKLERRFPHLEIANNPGHAADAQTGRAGDFVVGNTVYHVTAAPGLPVMQKCNHNLASGQRPVLLVPRSSVTKAIVLAEATKIEKRLMIFAIEDFLALNIVELAGCNDGGFLTVLRDIIETYNRRLREVESDLSLVIDID